MYSNIGKKIKVLTVIVTVILMLGALGTGAYFIVEGMDYFDYGGDYFVYIGIAIAVGGPILAWIMSFVMYGFGQLIDNTDKLVTLGQANSAACAAPVYVAPAAPVAPVGGYAPVTPVAPVVPVEIPVPTAPIAPAEVSVPVAPVEYAPVTPANVPSVPDGVNVPTETIN